MTAFCIKLRLVTLCLKITPIKANVSFRVSRAIRCMDSGATRFRPEGKYLRCWIRFTTKSCASNRFVPPPHVGSPVSLTFQGAMLNSLKWYFCSDDLIQAAQSHEIGCLRSGEIQCPRCPEITHQVVRTDSSIPVKMLLSSFLLLPKHSKS